MEHLLSMLEQNTKIKDEKHEKLKRFSNQLSQSKADVDIKHLIESLLEESIRNSRNSKIEILTASRDKPDKFRRARYIDELALLAESDDLEQDEIGLIDTEKEQTQKIAHQNPRADYLNPIKEKLRKITHIKGKTLGINDLIARNQNTENLDNTQAQVNPYYELLTETNPYEQTYQFDKTDVVYWNLQNESHTEDSTYYDPNLSKMSRDEIVLFCSDYLDISQNLLDYAEQYLKITPDSTKYEVLTNAYNPKGQHNRQLIVYRIRQDSYLQTMLIERLVNTASQVGLILDKQIFVEHPEMLEQFILLLKAQVFSWLSYVYNVYLVANLFIQAVKRKQFVKLLKSIEELLPKLDKQILNNGLLYTLASRRIYYTILENTLDKLVDRLKMLAGDNKMTIETEFGSISEYVRKLLAVLITPSQRVQTKVVKPLLRLSELLIWHEKLRVRLSTNGLLISTNLADGDNINREHKKIKLELISKLFALTGYSRLLQSVITDKLEDTLILFDSLLEMNDIETLAKFEQLFFGYTNNDIGITSQRYSIIIDACDLITNFKRV